MLTKIAFITVFSVILACNSVTENNQANAEPKKIKAENIVVADFAIEGMVCAMGCAKTIEDEIAGMTGVASSSVNFETTKAHFEYDKTQLTEKEIITKIEGIADGQYKVSPWKEQVEPQKTDTESTNSNDDKSKVSVELPSFQIPNLFTFLINQV